MRNTKMSKQGMMLGTLLLSLMYTLILATSSSIQDRASAADPAPELFDATGDVYIQLNYVGGEMSEYFGQQYEQQCSEYFKQVLANLTPPVIDIEVKLLSQELLTTDSGSATSASYLRAKGSDLPPLLTLLRVSGKTESEAMSKGMNDVLFYAVLDNPDELVQSLQQASNGANLYFKLVETVVTFNANDPNVGKPEPASTSAPVPAATEPAPAPTTPSTPTTPSAPGTVSNSTTGNSTGHNNSTNSTGNSTATKPLPHETLPPGAVIGIVIAIFVGASFVGFLFWYFSLGGEEEDPALAGFKQ